MGLMLTRFLNADLSCFETAYNDFFFAYGFELIKEYELYDGFKGKFNSEDEFIRMIKKIYEQAKYDLIEIQENYKKCVDKVYNLDGKDEAKDSKPYTRFVAYMIVWQKYIGSYSSNIDVILDNYSNQFLLMDYANNPFEEIVRKIESHKISAIKHDVYTSEKLASILYIVLEQVAQSDNLQIKKCQSCGKYFIPTSRLDEIYCDFPVFEGKTCREKGAVLTYKKNLENVPALLEYRRSYQKKLMEVSRNKEDKQLKADFDKWKKEAQEKIKLFKSGKLAEEKLYKWLLESK